MPRYLITVTPACAAVLEGWVGGRLQIVPAPDPLGTPGIVTIAGLDAVGFDSELAAVDARLSAGGPRYHAPGGPAAPGHRTLNEILADAIRAARGDQARLPGLRAEYDAAAAALFGMLAAT